MALVTSARHPYGMTGGRPSNCQALWIYGCLGTDMQVRISDQRMSTVVVVGTAKLMRLKLHHFGHFGVGEACIHVQSVKFMLAWPKIPVAIYLPDVCIEIQSAILLIKYVTS